MNLYQYSKDLGTVHFQGCSIYAATKLNANTLCCGIPNALRRNNPYNDLQSAEYYKTILKQIKDEWKSE